MKNESNCFLLENKASKFCMDAGFIHVVEIGQYFMTKGTGEQFFARACREYTLPRSDESSQPKGWIQGNTRIGHVYEITTSYLYGERGIEIRIWSLSKEFSILGHNFSWIKKICDWFKQQHRKSCRSAWRTSVKTEGEGFCSQIEGKSKTTQERTCWLFTEHHSDEWKKVDWYWTEKFLPLFVRDLEESNPFFLFSISTTRRTRSSSILENKELSSESISTNTVFIGLMIVGKYAWQQEEERKGDISTVLIFQEVLFSDLFKDIQDAISLILRYRTMW